MNPELEGLPPYMRVIRPGEYIDVLDSTNHWCVALVQKMDLAAKEIHIHFEAWSARYDEVWLD